MEAPAALLFAIFFITGKSADTLTAAIFLIMWEAHYLHRSFIYPLRFRDNTKKMPVIIAGMAFFFNVVNAYLNGRYLFDLSGGYSPEWLGGPRFLIGCVLFIIGMIINQQADGVLRRLRKQGESVYRIPRGGLYRWISCPNYFGEILEWSGWAIATWSPAGLSFAVWTIAVLLPRARSHHIWYRSHFSDYPPAGRFSSPVFGRGRFHPSDFLPDGGKKPKFFRFFLKWCFHPSVIYAIYYSIYFKSVQSRLNWPLFFSNFK